MHGELLCFIYDDGDRTRILSHSKRLAYQLAHIKVSVRDTAPVKVPQPFQVGECLERHVRFSLLRYVHLSNTVTPEPPDPVS